MIRYVDGDATSPDADGPVIIAHGCNDTGRWGAGFTRSLNRRWAAPGNAYHRWHTHGSGFELGAIQLVDVEPDVWVANMITQHGVRDAANPQPIRYDAVTDCLRALAAEAIRLHAAVHMPRIGAGLAGGDWTRIEPLIESQLHGIDTVVYNYPQ